MDTEQPRHMLALYGSAGALVWGLFHLVTLIRSGQPVSVADGFRAFANVLAALLVGALVAYFLGPALTPMVPITGLRDPHVVGFGLGALGWEGLPIVLDFARRWGKRQAREKL